MSTPTQVLIGLGANIDPEKHIEAAIKALSEQLTLHGISTVFRSPAIGRPEQPDYLNTMVLAESALAAIEVKQDILLPIESALGRIRSEDKYAARTIDLDLVLYGEQEINQPNLQIPDPDISQRVFLAAGAAELLPHGILPGTTMLLKDLYTRQDLQSLQAEYTLTNRLRETFLQ